MALEGYVAAAVAIGMILAGGDPATGTQGFGASTPGGSAGAVVRVTNLNNTGPGSLREAVAGGNRTVVFDVAGTITLTSEITIRDSFTTVDGLSAPAARRHAAVTRASSSAGPATTLSSEDSAFETRGRMASG